MRKESNYNNKSKIFCVYFKNNDKQYDFGECEGKAEEILKKIAALGGTDHIYKSDNLEGLYKIFDNISDAIQNKYSLKINN